MMNAMCGTDNYYALSGLDPRAAPGAGLYPALAYYALSGLRLCAIAEAMAQATGAGFPCEGMNEFELRQQATTRVINTQY